MHLTTNEVLAKELFKQTVYQKILANKVNDLSTQIEHFLLNGLDYSDDYEKIGAFNFEFDHYLSFQYVGYPNYLFEYSWRKNVIFDVSKAEDSAIKLALKESFMNNTEISKGIREQLYYDIIRESDCLFFCEAWKKAKEKINSNKLCFVEIHDCGAGYDCDTQIRLSESEIENKIESWKNNFS